MPKIKDGNANKRQDALVDINEIYSNLLENYPNVFVQKIEDIVFMYRPIGRKEYRQVLESNEVNDLEKEEIICEICTLWPEDFDFEDCDAGIPTVLYNKIIENSYLDSEKSVRELANYYRREMYEKDHQITCIINEAFPNIDIEEIEEWDMDKTIKYFSRAEWKLVNFRGGQIVEDIFASSEDEAYEEEAKQDSQPKQEENVHTPPTTTPPGKVETLEERQKRLEAEGFFNKKQKLTPEKLAELKAKYPEMQFSDDVLSNNNDVGIGGTANTISPALRTGW